MSSDLLILAVAHCTWCDWVYRHSHALKTHASFQDRHSVSNCLVQGGIHLCLAIHHLTCAAPSQSLTELLSPQCWQPAVL
jgi:hypothetical protein